MEVQIMQILNEARSWSSMDLFGGRPDVVDEVDEYVYSLPTVDFVRGRANIVDRRLTVYHAALCACADLKSTTVSLSRLYAQTFIKFQSLHEAHGSV